MVKKTVTITLDPEDVKFIDDKSKENGVSRSLYMRQLVKERIKNEKAGKP